jgi:hypothetical protein
MSNSYRWYQIGICIVALVVEQNLMAGGEVARIFSKDIAEGVERGIGEGVGKAGAEALSEDAIKSSSEALADTVGRTLEQGLKDAGIDITKVSSEQLEKALKNIGNDLGDVFKSGGGLKVSDRDLSAVLKASFDKEFGNFGGDVSKASLNISASELQRFSELESRFKGGVTLDIGKEDPIKKELDAKYNEAQQEYTTAKKEYDDIKDKEGVAPAEREAKLNKFLEAEKKLDQITKDISHSNKFSLTERSWRYVQRKAWLERNYKGFVSKGIKTLREMFIQGAVMGTFFMLPGWVQQGLESFGQSQAVLRTVSAPQYVGNVWLQIPDELINEDDPLNIVPLYVGISTSTPDSVDALRKGVRPHLALDYAKAQFFVTSGDYGFGKYPLTTSPTSQMTHLNTGYDFYGDGSAVNKLVPMEQLLGQAGAQSRNKTLIQNMSEIAGKVQQGGVGKIAGVAAYEMPYYGGATKQAYQKPNPAIARVMQSTTLDEAPALLVPTLNKLAGDYQVGQLVMTPIKGLRGDAQAAGALGVQPTELAPALPYHAYNLFIYQTASTQLARVARASATSSVAPYLYDYVIALDKLGRYVPALIPLSSASSTQMTVFPAYGPNPAVGSVISLLDNTITTIDNQPQGTGDWTKVIKSDQLEAFSQLQPQISFMNKYITTQAAKGPFAIGSYTLSIPQELTSLYAKGVWIYEVRQADGLLEGSTAGKYADYVVPLDAKFSLVPLPSGAVKFFLSLVSSRVFDQHLVPVTEPIAFNVIHYATSAYTVLAPDVGIWQQQAAKDKVTFEMLFNATTPRYSLYMDYDINPYNIMKNKKIPIDVKSIGGSLGLAEQGLIPMRPQYAWTSLQMFLSDDQKQRVSARSYLEDKAPTFVARVQNTYQQWRKVLMPLMNAINLVGPFNFTTKLLDNVRIQATSLDDVQHGNYVYTSLSLRQDYLVVALQPNAADSSIGAAFNVIEPQPYLISLTNGMVYMRDENDKVAPAKNEQGGVITLPITELIATVQRNEASSFLSPLLATLKTAQKKYAAERPDKQFFYRFGLYLDPQDEAKGSYVYQDDTTIAKENYGKLDKALDFFVGAQLSADGTPVQVGQRLTGDTQIIISLVNGAIYDRKGYVSLVGKTDQIGFVSAYDTFAGSLPSIRSALRDEIKKRVAQLADAYQKEQASLQRARQKELPPLDSNLVAQIKNNDFMVSPYDSLKMVGDHYYGVTSIPLGTTNVESIFDYGTGILYDNDGNALLTYKGLLLDDMRRSVGIGIGTGGNQSLGVPYSSIHLPVVDKDTKSAFIPLSSLQQGFGQRIMLGTTLYELFFNTVGLNFIARVTPKGGNAYYLDIYGGYRYNLDGSPYHANALSAQGKKNILYKGEYPNGTQWLLVPQDGGYQQYQFKTTLQTASGEAFIAENSYLAQNILLYERTTDTKITYSLLKEAGTDESGNARFIFDDLYIQQGTAEVINYMRSGAGGDHEYANAAVTYDASQDVPVLVIRSGDTVSKVLAKRSANSLDMIIFDARLERSGKDNEKIYTLSKVFNGTTYSFTFRDHRIDAGTSGLYASINDATTNNYFSYDTRPLMADKLQQLQDQLDTYVIIDVLGMPRLVKSLSLNVKTIGVIQQVPDAVRSLADRVMQTGAFKYDPIANRYLYQLAPSDQGKPYYRDGIAYIDLLYGILYFGDGKPAIIPLLPSQLMALQNEKHVSVPLDSKGNPLVSSSPYLVYK